MTLDKTPTAAMIDELKSRLEKLERKPDQWDYELAIRYLDWIETLLREGKEDKSDR